MYHFNSHTRWLAGTVRMSLSLAIACGGDIDEEGTATPGDEPLVVTAATTGGEYQRPADSVPTDSGDTLYFVAERTGGGNSVFSVPGEGGEATDLIPDTSLFVSPRGIDLSTDGTRLYVADPDLMDGQGGMVMVVLETLAVAVVSGTEGTTPRALDVVPGAVGDVVYFVGKVAGSDDAAILKIPAEGGTATTVISGNGLVTPDGVAADSSGVLYIVDRDKAGPGLGQLLRYSGQLEILVSDILPGEPAGVAVTTDNSTVVVSAMDRQMGTDEVLLVSTEDKSVHHFTQVVGENTAAGGVHRAPNRDVFAWADSAAGGRGMVYRINPN